jgi:prolyl 4-hydroxylase
MNRGGTRKGNDTVITDVRVAQVRWAQDHENEVVARISRRVSDMSGLSVETSEMLHVQNYGIGGHYDLHHDYSERGVDFNLGTGNRIATVLFYVIYLKISRLEKLVRKT